MQKKQKKQEAAEPKTKVNDAIIYVSLNKTLYYLIILTIMNND